MTSLLKQIKQRRRALGLKQHDMMLRAGVSRQQYQRLEAKGNPRLDTLELIAKGLNSELMLIPKDKLAAVMAMLEKAGTGPDNAKATDRKKSTNEDEMRRLSEAPWEGLLGDES